MQSDCERYLFDFKQDFFISLRGSKPLLQGESRRACGFKASTGPPVILSSNESARVVITINYHDGEREEV